MLRSSQRLVYFQWPLSEKGRILARGFFRAAISMLILPPKKNKGAFFEKAFANLLTYAPTLRCAALMETRASEGRHAHSSLVATLSPWSAVSEAVRSIIGAHAPPFGYPIGQKNSPTPAAARRRLDPRPVHRTAKGVPAPQESRAPNNKG